MPGIEDTERKIIMVKVKKLEQLRTLINEISEDGTLSVMASIDGKGAHVGKVKGISQDTNDDVIIEVDIEHVSSTTESFFKKEEEKAEKQVSFWPCINASACRKGVIKLAVIKPFFNIQFCHKYGCPVPRAGLSIRTKAGNVSTSTPFICPKCKGKKKR